MSGRTFASRQRHMTSRTGYGRDRADALALREARDKALAALDRLEKNPGNAALRADALAKRDRLAALYLQHTGRDLFDHALGIRPRGAS